MRTLQAISKAGLGWSEYKHNGNKVDYFDYGPNSYGPMYCGCTDPITKFNFVKSRTNSLYHGAVPTFAPQFNLIDGFHPSPLKSSYNNCPHQICRVNSKSVEIINHHRIRSNTPRTFGMKTRTLRRGEARNQFEKGLTLKRK